MHDRWPFFRAMLNNMGMVLAKADLDIGRLYADTLVTDPELRDGQPVQLERLRLAGRAVHRGQLDAADQVELIESRAARR